LCFYVGFMAVWNKSNNVEKWYKTMMQAISETTSQLCAKKKATSKSMSDILYKKCIALTFLRNTCSPHG